LDDESDSGSSRANAFENPCCLKKALSSQEKVQEYVDQIAQTKLTTGTEPLVQIPICDAELFQGLKAMTVSVQESQPAKT
jgi:hypothetical protein